MANNDNNQPSSQGAAMDMNNAIMRDYLKEQKRRRRWGIFFKLLYAFLFLFFIMTIFFPSKNNRAVMGEKPHVGLINIRGVIADKAQAGADKVATALRKAYKDKGTKAIILRINSPGGSPVQADYIYGEIMRYRKKFPKIKVYAVCTDMCASAAYYIAAAADEIYANPSSLVGSIGVLYNGFGFTGSLEKLGVERRLLTAGKNKGFMDPFSKVEPGQKEMMQNMLDDIHSQFEMRVENGRGNRLKKDPEIFSGLFWTGKQARMLGLIDDFGSAGYVARNIVKIDRVYDYTVKRNVFERLAKQFGTAMGTSLGMVMSDRMLADLGFDQNAVQARALALKNS